MTQKSICQTMRSDGSMIPYWESKALFAMKEEEYQKLREKIVGVIEKETTVDFDEKLNRLIILMRYKAYIHMTAKSSTVIQKEISALEKKISNLQQAVNNLSISTYHELSQIMLAEYDSDLLYDMRAYLHSALEICTKTREQLLGSKPTFTPHHMRQILAEEIARELDKMKVPLKKSRNGKFEQCLRAIINAVSCTVNGKKISISSPLDLFPIIEAAIDDFPNKEPYSLLEMS